MKILVVCQYYYPEPFRITDICEELVKRGHEVQVITGYPNYPEGAIYDGYGKNQRIDEVINGVKVHRCYTIPRKSGAVYRLLNYFSYAISSKRYIKSIKFAKVCGNDFDVVFCNQLSPVMMANGALAYKKKYKTPVVLYCMDLWPESLVAGGITRNSTIYKMFHRISERIYKKCDRILVTSKMFIEYMSDKFAIEKKNISYLPQYAEDVFSKVKSHRDEKETIDFVFAGNIGEMQNLQIVIEAAEMLQHEKTVDASKVVFHIVGGGTDLRRIKDMARNKGLSNVLFYGRKPLVDMPYYYAMADAMIITLGNDPVISMTLPGKVQSYMAASKPIVGAVDGEAANVINESQCGVVGSADNVEKMIENIKKIVCMNSKEREQFGVNGRGYYEKHFMKETFMNELEKALKSNGFVRKMK